MACNTSVTQLVLGDSLGWGVGIYVCTCRIGAQMLYAPSGSTEATAFGGTSSDVAVKENMVMLNKVEWWQYHAERRPLDLEVGNWKKRKRESGTRKEMCGSVLWAKAAPRLLWLP